MGAGGGRLYDRNPLEEQQGFRSVVRCTYRIPKDKSLADADLEEGDTWPEDSNYEIVSATEKPFAPPNARNGAITHKQVSIVAVKYDTGA